MRVEEVYDFDLKPEQMREIARQTRSELENRDLLEREETKGVGTAAESRRFDLRGKKESVKVDVDPVVVFSYEV